MNQHPGMEELQAYAAGEVHNEHIDSCDVCRAHIARFAAIDDALRALPELKAPDLDVQAVSKSVTPFWLPGHHTTQLLAAALACVVLFAAGLLTGIRLDRTDELPKHVAVDPLGAPAGSAEFAGMLLAERDGLRVVSVTPGTPAAALGLQPGDIIFAADGMPLRTIGDLESLRAETAVRLEWKRPQLQTQSGTLELRAGP